MSESRQVRFLLDRLQALDAEIESHRSALAGELADSEVESHRVALGMLGFQRQKTFTELRQAGWRPNTPEQRELLP
jgi:hypothetical protein